MQVAYLGLALVSILTHASAAAMIGSTAVNEIIGFLHSRDLVTLLERVFMVDEEEGSRGRWRNMLMAEIVRLGR